MLTTAQAQDRLRQGEKVFVKFNGPKGAFYTAPVQSIQSDNITRVRLHYGDGFLAVSRQRVLGFAATAEELDARKGRPGLAKWR